LRSGHHIVISQRETSIIPEQPAHSALAGGLATTEATAAGSSNTLFSRSAKPTRDIAVPTLLYGRQFPNNVYKQALANLPTKSSYRRSTAQRWKSAKGDPTRDRLCLSRASLSELTRSEVDVDPRLSSPRNRHALYAKLSVYIASAVRQLQWTTNRLIPMPC